MKTNDPRVLGAVWTLTGWAILAALILVSTILAGAEFSLRSFAVSLGAGLLGALAVTGLYLVASKTIYKRAVIDFNAAASLTGKLDRAQNGDLSEPWDDLPMSIEGQSHTIALNEAYGLLVGVLGEANRMSSELKRLATEIMDQAHGLSQGADDQSAAVSDSTASINNIDSSIRRVAGSVEELADMSENVSAATYEMLANIDEVSSTAQALSETMQEAVSATEQMAGNIHGVAESTGALSTAAAQSKSSMEDIERATKSIRDRAEDSARFAESAREGASQAKEMLSDTVSGIRGLTDKMESTHEVMHQLGVHSRSIGEILTVISSVAADTHLLSLNASIMAAKAGEHGRGFSVVAQEIKTLAKRTTESAKEIEGLILSTQESVDLAMSAIEEGKARVKDNMRLSEKADLALAEVLERVEIAARNSHEIAEATETQAATNDQVVKAVEDVARQTDQIKTAMREQEMSSGYVREMAVKNQDLVNQVAHAMLEQSESSRLIASSMERLTKTVQNIRGATEDEADNSAGIVKAIDAIQGKADLVAIGAQNVSNTSLSVLHHSLLLRSELKGIELPEAKASINLGVVFDNLREERWRRERGLFNEKAAQFGAMVEFRVAEGDRELQGRQVRELVDLGVDALILVAVDGEAIAEHVEYCRRKKVPVIVYDRFVKNCDYDLFVSFDGVKIGRLQAEIALQKMTGPDVLILCGSPTDMNSHFLYKGQMEVLKQRIERREISLVEEFWVKNWDPEEAYRLVRETIEKKGPMDAIIAANDGNAGGAIRAVQELIADRKVVVTGMDAEAVACKRILEGSQAMTAYMPINLQCSRAVEGAMLILKNEEIPGITGKMDTGRTRVPAILLRPIKVDADNLEEVIVKAGFHSKEAIYG